MHFPLLKIENFMAITTAEIALANRGLVLIAGKNSVDTSAVSNGAGKSSIADALCWCWYGVTARGSAGDDIVNDVAGKNCKVVSTLQDGPLLYTATRYRKHKTGKNTFQLTMHDGFKETDLTKGTDKLTQEVATQVIGASLDVFVGSIYAGQERMPDLPAMTDKGLKMLIEEASGVLVLEEAYKKSLKDALESEREYDRQVLILDGFESNKIRLQGEVVSGQIEETDWEDVRKVRAAGLKDAVTTTTVPALKKVMAEIAKIIPGASARAITECDVKIAAVKGEQEERVTLDSKVAFASGTVKAAEKALENAEAMLSTHIRQHVHVGDKIGEPCTECGRPLTEAELGDATIAAADKVALAKDLVATCDLELADTETAYKQAIEKRDLFVLSLTDVSATTTERAAYAASQHVENDMILLRDQLTREAKDFKARIDAVNAEINPHTARIARNQVDLDARILEIAALQKKVKALELDVLTNKDVAKVFGPAGVRARILDEVTPFLNAQTAKYLDVLSDSNLTASWSTLTPGAKKGTFKEKFSIDVANTTGGKTFKLISGGEKRKVRIATALALQDLVATRASKPIDLFIGDEIDDALDAAGIERMTMVLEEKANERGSVFIISHNEIRDFVPNVIEIEKTATGTVVREIAA
jgi:DNA repair exonuclease SbcCD ATPase subunit